MAKAKDIDNLRKLQTNMEAAKQSLKEANKGLAWLLNRAGLTSDIIFVENSLNNNSPVMIEVDQKTAGALKAIGFQPVPDKSRAFEFGRFDDESKYEALVTFLLKCATDKEIEATLTNILLKEVNNGISRINALQAHAANALPGIRMQPADEGLWTRIKQAATEVLSGKSRAPNGHAERS